MPQVRKSALGLTIVVAMALGACGGPTQGQLVEVQQVSPARPVTPDTSDVSNPSSQPESAGDTSAEPTVASTGFLPPDTSRLPAAAERLEPGDFGISDEGDGTIQGTLSTSGMRCDGDSLLRISTADATYILGVSRIGAWTCDSALDQWRTVSPTESMIGLRYSADSGVQSVLLVNDSGGSLSLRVDGLWRVS